MVYVEYSKNLLSACRNIRRELIAKITVPKINEILRGVIEKTESHQLQA